MDVGRLPTRHMGSDVVKVTIEVEWDGSDEPTAFAGGLRDNILEWFESRKIPATVKYTRED